MFSTSLDYLAIDQSINPSAAEASCATAPGLLVFTALKFLSSNAVRLKPSSSRATRATRSVEESAIRNHSRASLKAEERFTNLIFGCGGGFQSGSPKTYTDSETSAMRK